MKHMEELQLREAKQKHETPEKKNLNKKYLIFQYMCVCVCNFYSPKQSSKTSRFKNAKARHN